MNPPQSQIPLFVSLDGIDGVGKSTQIVRLIEYLTDQGHRVVNVCDPGSSEVGQKLRQILLNSDLKMHRRTEAMLFMASRCEMIEATIRPALAEGKTVISDRFLLANVVYQSVGGDVDADQLWQMGHWANNGFQPDLTILLDMPADSAIERIDGPADRMESRGVEYMESVRQAFLKQLPKASPATIIINADQAIDDVTKEMLDQVAAYVATR